MVLEADQSKTFVLVHIWVWFPRI